MRKQHASWNAWKQRLSCDVSSPSEECSSESVGRVAGSAVVECPAAAVVELDDIPAASGY